MMVDSDSEMAVHHRAKHIHNQAKSAHVDATEVCFTNNKFSFRFLIANLDSAGSAGRKF